MAKPDMGTFVEGTRAALAAALTLAVLAHPLPAAGEAGEVRLAWQDGIAYLPIQAVVALRLIEKHAKNAGLGAVRIEARRFDSGIAVNQAVLAGHADFGAAGTTVMLSLWDRTKGSEFETRGAIALAAMPLKFITTDPRIAGLKDFDGRADHRIAVPETRVSIHAVTLRMGAEKVFGPGQAHRLDPLLLALPHPQAAAAILGSRKTVQTHIAALPYAYQEISAGRGRVIATSAEIVGGPHTTAVLFATRKWKDRNPKLFKAVAEAATEALGWLREDSRRAARFHKDQAKSKQDIAEIEAMFADAGEIAFAPAPKNTMPFALFLERTGAIKARPASWKDYFWETAHGFDGG
jgi:NitT/TauT family transport system substrate-binding protein